MTDIQSITHPLALEQLGLPLIEPEARAVGTAIDYDISAVGDFVHTVAALRTLNAMNIRVVFHMGFPNCCCFMSRLAT